MNTITVTVISPTEIEKMVREVVNRDYEFLSYEECGTDGAYLCEYIDGKMDEWHKDDIKKLRKTTSHTAGIHALLNYLCKKKLIPTGNYLVESSQ